MRKKKELNEKEKELNEKKQELQNNTRKINDLIFQNKLLKEKLNDSKTKEHNELRNEIEKLKEAKVKGSNIIDDLTKSNKALSTAPIILQDLRKRDDKARTFAPPDDDDEMKNLAELTKAKLKTPDDLVKIEFTRIKSPEDFKMKNFLENTNKYEDINVNSVNNLIKEIEKNITEGDNIVDLGDGKEVYFRDLFNFLHDIKDNKINNFNKKEQYEKRFMNTENKLANRKKYNRNIRLYEKYLNDLKNH